MPENPMRKQLSESPRVRLLQARVQAKKSPEDLASAAEINVASYYDLEWVDGELESNLPLGAIQKLCAELGINSRDLFMTGTIGSDKRLSPEDLVEAIKKHLELHNISISDFEAKVGFKIG